MNPEDARKLLGGYATGTLTAAEQEALFAAALEDQELFDALLKEEPLREVLRDPASKAQLLAALETPAARSTWWNWRPLIGAVAMAGIALAAIAIWRTGPKDRAAPVIVAEAPKLPPASRNMAIEPQVPASSAAAPAPAKSKPAPAPKEMVETRSARAAEVDATKTERPAIARSAEGGASPVNAPGAPAGAVQQPAVPPQAQLQTQRQGLVAPPPLFQQQSAPSVSLDAAPALNRAAAVSSFRGKEVSADQMLDKKSAPLLQWSILRGDRELPPDTVLDAGETVRLRIVSLVAGSLTLRDGDKVLVSAPVEAAKAFDTPPIPFTTSGARTLRVTLLAPPAQPVTMGLTLNYGQPK